MRAEVGDVFRNKLTHRVLVEVVQSEPGRIKIRIYGKALPSKVFRGKIGIDMFFKSFEKISSLEKELL